MHLPRWMITLLVTLTFATGAAFTAVAQSKKQLKQAQKLLAQLKLVDGPGSGLDADTVQGVTVSQLKASITPPTPAEILTAVESVDGAGSGLDADKLQGFTPAQIAALAPSGGGLVVRDANEALVGTLVKVSDDEVVRQIGGQFLRFVVARPPSGFYQESPVFQYESSNCTGVQLLDDDTLTKRVTVHGMTAYYPSGPAAHHTIGSFLYSTDSAGCADLGGLFKMPDRCCVICDSSAGDSCSRSSSPVSQFDVTPLGLVPPFHLSAG